MNIHKLDTHQRYCNNRKQNDSQLKQLFWLLVTALSYLTTGYGQTTQNSPAAAAPDHQSKMSQMSLTAPLVILDAETDGTLQVVHASSTPVQLQIMFDNESAPPKVMLAELPAFGKVKVSLNEAVKRLYNSAFFSGSVSVTQVEEVQDSLGAQISYEHRGLEQVSHFDQELSMPSNAGEGQIFRATLAEHTLRSVVAVRNLTDKPTSVRVRCLSTDGRSQIRDLRLKPMRSVIANSCGKENYNPKTIGQLLETESADEHIAAIGVDPAMPDTIAVAGFSVDNSKTVRGLAFHSDIPGKVRHQIFVGSTLIDEGLTYQTPQRKTVTLANFSPCNHELGDSDGT